MAKKGAPDVSTTAIHEISPGTLRFQVSGDGTPSLPASDLILTPVEADTLYRTKSVKEILEGRLSREVWNTYDREEIELDFINAINEYHEKKVLALGERGYRVLSSMMSSFEGFFDSKQLSHTTDIILGSGSKITGHHFVSISSPNDPVEKLQLYYYGNGIYHQGGAGYLAQLLENIREGMISALEIAIHKYGEAVDYYIQTNNENIDHEIERLETAEDDYGNPIGKQQKKAKINDLETKYISKLELDSQPEIRQFTRNEILNAIRSRCQIDRQELNQGGYIPLRNGLLNLSTWQLENFRSNVYVTYRVEGRLLDISVSLEEIPMFRDFVSGVYPTSDMEAYLDYIAYSLHPGFPRQKVALILGPPRIGKGTSVRLIRSLLPEGSGPLNLKRLLESEKFVYSGSLDWNLITDMDTRRSLRKGSEPNWASFTTLFGGDDLYSERKNHEAENARSKAKGIIVGNLPFFRCNDPPALSRLIIIMSKNAREGGMVDDLETKILETERDLIVTFLLQRLQGIAAKGYILSGERSIEENGDLLDKLSDSTIFFGDEMIMSMIGENVWVEKDEAFHRYEKWCAIRGIPPTSKQTFTYQIGKQYPEGKRGPRGNQIPVFTGCQWVNEGKEEEREREKGGTKNKSDTEKTSGDEPVKPLVNENTPVSDLVSKSMNTKKILKNEKMINHVVQEYVPRSDTGFDTQKSPINQGPTSQKPVSDLSGPPLSQVKLTRDMLLRRYALGSLFLKVTFDLLVYLDPTVPIPQLIADVVAVGWNCDHAPGPGEKTVVFHWNGVKA